MKRLLWLDDYRDPFDPSGNWLIFSPITDMEYEVFWVKNYQEFVGWITENDLPDGICFDHDLDPNQGLEGLEVIDEKTGMDCVKWLVDYCINNNKNLPLYNIQSANPVGKENMDLYLKNYLKSINNGK